MVRIPLSHSRKGCLLWSVILSQLLAGCSMFHKVHGDDKGTIIPTLRYVEDRDGDIRHEDISDGSVEVLDETLDFPVAEGAMTVDCQSAREIGVIVRHGYISQSQRYNSHDFDFVASWPDAGAREPKHFTYEKWLKGWFRKGATRFREPLVNGRIELSVTHRGQIIYTTEFEVVGC